MNVYITTDDLQLYNTNILEKTIHPLFLKHSLL